jgi:hypothetical protein
MPLDDRRWPVADIAAAVQSSHVKASRFLICALVVWTATACTRPFTIKSVGVEEAASYPRTIYDFNYGFDDNEYFERKDREGSVRILFESGSDIERIARGWGVHHVYYTLYDCTNPRLYVQTGDIFPAGTNGDQHRYEAYVPARFSDFVYGAANGEVTKGWPKGLLLKDGLCFRVQGGSMAGLGIQSNEIHVDELLERISHDP